MKQKIERMFGSDKALVAFSVCMYIVGCVIEAHI